MTTNTPLFSGKRVALVHDWLNGMRGGEKVLEVFCEIFPDAHIYTLLHETGKLSETIESKTIHTSFIQKLPQSFSKYRHYLPLFPWAIEQFDMREYDIILSSSHCVAKGVKHDKTTFHASYVHAPMRYMWHLFDTYFGEGRSSKLVYSVARMIRPFLQRWDLQSSKRVDTFFSNSENVQKQIQKIYDRSSTVIHPPVDLSFFRPGTKKDNYYLMVGAFAPNKRVDLSIQAFNQLGLPLKIVGNGQDEAHCRSIAGPSIEFLGSVGNEEIRSLYQGARAFVFPGEDDFGITPLEAQASGTPVIAFAKGGALETVTEQTGIFFREQSVPSIVDAIQSMESKWQSFELEACVQQAEKFNRDRFKQEIITLVGAAYEQWLKTQKPQF